MLEAVKHSAEALRYGSERVRSESQVLREAVRHSWRAVAHAKQLDPISILTAVQEDWRAISIYLDQASLEEVDLRLGAGKRLKKA